VTFVLEKPSMKAVTNPVTEISIHTMEKGKEICVQTSADFIMNSQYSSVTRELKRMSLVKTLGEFHSPTIIKTYFPS
jgi:hypothetical protein